MVYHLKSLIFTGFALGGLTLANPFETLQKGSESIRLLNDTAKRLLKGGYSNGVVPPNGSISRYDAARLCRDFARIALENPKDRSTAVFLQIALLQEELAPELEIQGYPESSRDQVLALASGRPQPKPGLRGSAAKDSVPSSPRRVQFSGELRLRPEFRNTDRRAKGPESYEQQSYRMRLRVDRKLEQGDFFATLQQQGFFGEQEYNLKTRPTQTNPDADLEFVEFGYQLDLDANGNSQLTAGRQFFQFAKALVSDSQFSDRGRTFDGLHFLHSTQSTRTQAFLSRLAREDYANTTALNPGIDPEGLFYGLDHEFSLSSGTYRLYAYDRVENEADGIAGAKENLLSYGITAKHELNPRLKLRWTQILQDGDFSALALPTRELEGEFQEVELDYRLSSDSLVDARYTRFSGDPDGGRDNVDQAFTKVYGSGHSWLGKTDFIDTRNAAEYVLGYKRRLNPELRLGLSFHWIRLDEASQAPVFRSEFPAYAQSGLTHNPANQENDLGTELDLVLNWKWSETMSFVFVHGWFQSGKYFTANGGQDFDGHYTYLTTTFHF